MFGVSITGRLKNVLLIVKRCHKDIAQRQNTKSGTRLPRGESSHVDDFDAVYLNAIQRMPCRNERQR